MSVDIIYHMVGSLMPMSLTGAAENLFLIAAQIGDNRTYEIGHNGRDGRRARSWCALHFGTHDEVLAQAIRTAGGFEGGGIRLDSYSRAVRPETYIARARRLLAESHANDLSMRPLSYRGQYLWITPQRRIPKGTGSEFDDAREAVSWDDCDGVRRFFNEILSTPERRAGRYFNVHGPELR